ncbi:TadE/TadG family type IV pilus assembly protein [Actinomadura bangladeshensis]|uniref:Pilus assembly protein TadE n=1 Tax=Actinomadura bangladeshensis TaxID=453573 RepID=A0A4R4NWG3_9ACTN|nr:TadE/TadG family type IV pilus assembly protein [Actinomadura bangladeshensis]TDC12407.1 pilus assembly protein TadE [Actinomadura bangladeshensis]
MIAMARAGRPRDRGGVTVEFAAALPAGLLIIFLAFEALMVSTTVERVENAARTGARTAAQRQAPGECPAAAMASMPGWLNEKHAVAGGGRDEVTCRVQAKVPLVFPGIPLDFGVNRTVTMPLG